MQRGIVIDIGSKNLVVMTADGLFIKIPNQNPKVQIGEEISFTSAQTKRKINWKVYISGAVAAILALFFLFPSFLDNQAYAKTHVYVEIEPGIEIGLNEKLEVVQVRPVNKEAKGLIGRLDWNEEPVKKVVVDYLKQAKDKGYLRKNDEIVLSAINEKGSSKSTLQSIRTVIDDDPKIGKKAFGLQVFTFSMPQVMKKKAEKTGLTPGKYGVWLLSKKSGKEIPVDQISKMPISDLTDDVSLLDHPPTENEWKEIVNEDQGNEPTNTSDPIKTEPNTNPTPNKEQQTPNIPLEQQNELEGKDNNKQEPPPTNDSNQTKDDNQQNPSKDEGGEENNSTMGSTGDTQSQTNHAMP